ncbi:MAG: excinuclease ABC subunit UvrC [Gammaproteobacteria bacterium]|nr:excinuclease ABC subunit UvrC [Gammaproteobacteria bacterium]
MSSEHVSGAEREAFDSAAFLKNLPHKPGVYRMLDTAGTVIYVGKARNLKKRVGSYFQKVHDNPKTRALVAAIAAMEFTVTNSETEALLLENNYIKALRPRYNIVLRDDKSYPYIHLSGGDYPRLSFHRGAKTGGGRYFGPYPSAGAVRSSLWQLQKLFRVRQCEDSFFANRSRPCLQYQIKRCTGPCVGLVSKEDYAEDVRLTSLFLEGKNQEILNALGERMEQCAKDLEFERAARYRDQLIALRRVQEVQSISQEDSELDIDAVAVLSAQGLVCVLVLYVRGGRVLGSKSFFPALPQDDSLEDVLTAFLPQYYLNREDLPREVVSTLAIEEAELLETALAELAGRRVRFASAVRGERLRWLQLARQNAETELAARLANRQNAEARLDALQEALNLDAPPARLECFDISHTQGELTVASCVVFEQGGPKKSDYRRFNIEGITPGDDYAAMHQALSRRYARLKAGEAAMPDILLIDGGANQLAQAETVLAELDIQGITLLGVAKGESRKPGLERLFMPGLADPILLPADSPALHLIQHIRDEAHRFAITGHRQRRAKARNHSSLEDIPGIGPKRRRELLKYFGGLQEVKKAGVEELAKAPGISAQLAQTIYDALH